LVGDSSKGGGIHINSDTHVYCTNCKHFVLAEDKINGSYVGSCPNELKCNILNFEKE